MMSVRGRRRGRDIDFVSKTSTQQQPTRPSTANPSSSSRRYDPLNYADLPDSLRSTAPIPSSSPLPSPVLGRSLPLDKARRKKQKKLKSQGGGGGVKNSRGKSQGLRRKVKAATFAFHRRRKGVVVEAMKSLGVAQVGREDGDAGILWLDRRGTSDRLCSLRPHQKMNRFPGLAHLTQKATLSAFLYRARLAEPKAYDFYPRSWSLPHETPECIDYMETYGESMIVKPSSGSCGRGISLATRPEDLPSGRAADGMVAQEYIDNPLLLNGLKWDIRVYVLITGVDPLSVFLYREGLARFATAKYEPPSRANAAKAFMHLTNFSVNRHSDKFVTEDDPPSSASDGEPEDGTFGDLDQDGNPRSPRKSSSGATKRLMTQLFDELEDLGHDVDLLWWQIKALVGKTLHAISVPLATQYRACVPPSSDPSHCFHVLGFDVLVDDELNPWLLEINHSPSLECSMDVDWDVKLPMVEDAIRMLNPTGPPVKGSAGAATMAAGLDARTSGSSSSDGSLSSHRRAQYRSRVKRLFEDAHLGNWERVCPPSPAEAAEYDHSCLLGSPTLAYAFRSSCWKRYLGDPYPMGSQNFKKLLRSADLFSRRFTSMDSDLLFLQISSEEASGSQRISYGGLCEALIEVALRLFPDLDLPSALAHLISRFPRPETPLHAPNCCDVKPIVGTVTTTRTTSTTSTASTRTTT